MAMNERLEAAKTVMVDAYHGDYHADEYVKAKDEFFKVMEEEAKNDARPGSWLELEDNADCLIESIACGDGAEFVQEVLHSYIRYCAVVKRATGEERLDSMLVAQAVEYLNQ